MMKKFTLPKTNLSKKLSQYLKIATIFQFCFFSFILLNSCSLDIIDPPQGLKYSINSVTVKRGTAGHSVAPTIVDGGEAVTYIFSNQPDGVTINSTNGVISWSNSVVKGTNQMLVAASNSVSIVTANFTLTVIDAPSHLVYSTNSVTVKRGTASNSVVPTIIDGGEAVIYVLANHPSGVTINSANGIISWDNTLAKGTNQMIVSASNSVGGVSTSFTLRVIDAPTLLQYSVNPVAVKHGTAGNSVVPTILNEGEGVTYALANHPSGVTINLTNGVISWNNSVVKGTHQMTVTAGNSIGNATADFMLKVIDPPSSLVYSTNSVTAKRGVVGHSVAPTITDGGGEISYFLAQSPSGVGIESTGVISWDITVAKGIYQMTVTASNSVGNTTADFTLTVIDPPSQLEYSVSSVAIEQGVVAGHSVTPTITNGGEAVSYVLATPPSGVSINATNGVISWDTTVAKGSNQMTVTATNSVGGVSTNFTLVVKTTGVLTYSTVFKDGTAGVDGLQKTHSVTVSPDNKNVYVAGYDDKAIAVFNRNTTTGTLTYSAVFKNGTSSGGKTVAGLDGAISVTVSPDNKSVYVASYADDAIAVFNRNTTTGVLTYSAVFKDGVGGMDGLDGASSVTVSPDNRSVYVAGEADNAIAVFNRNTTNGALTYSAVFKDGVDGVDGLGAASSVTVSPDNKNVYVASYADDAIAVFNRNTTNGVLAYSAVFKDGVGGVAGLDGASSVTVSPDNKSVYVTSDGGNALAIFNRNTTTGALTYSTVFKDTDSGVDGLNEAISVTVSPDNKSVYVAGRKDHAIAVFNREKD